jgi:glycerophosphoryl diester phosphodiesterase
VSFPLPRIRACGADWAAVNYRLARLGVARACHQHGVGVMVWTVDSGPLIDRFLTDARIDVLVTNRPGHAARRRAALQIPVGTSATPTSATRLPAS